MDDLNDGLRTPGAIMLGGGNPAKIPQMTDYFTQLCADMLREGKLTDALCNYDGPQGKDALLQALAKMLRDEFGWQIEAQNIALTMVVRVHFSTYLIYMLDDLLMAHVDVCYSHWLPNTLAMQTQD